MNHLEKVFYGAICAVIFASAVFCFFLYLNIMDESNASVSRDILNKSSIKEYVGAEKEAVDIDTVKDTSTGEVLYVPIKGSDVIFDLINIVDTLSDEDIANDKIKIQIKVRGNRITPTSEEIQKIKNRKSTVINTIKDEIDNDAEYRRIYYYNFDLDINELNYEL